MIEQVINEILEAEENARAIQSDAMAKAAEINLKAAEAADRAKAEAAAKYKAESDLKKAEAEKKGELEAEKIIAAARAEAEKIKANAKGKTAKAADYVVKTLLGGEI